MVRLRALTISGFRGARYPLTLDLTKSCRSIAIFGENATGKSTITDGIEWFFRDKVNHLWREDCKEEALRNVSLDDKEDAEVSLEFSNTELSGKKRLTKAFEIVESNNNQAFRQFKTSASDERLVLRTAYLTEFINKRKGEKRKELADIIGYEALIDFRGLILGVLNSLEKDPDYTNAKRNQAAAQAKMMKVCGTLLIREEQYFAKASELVSQFQPQVKITDEASYSEGIQKLMGKIGQQQKAERRLKLGQLKDACEALSRAVKETSDSEDSFLKPYGRLVDNKEKIKLLDIEQFLSKGKKLLDKQLAEPNKCPFCGSRVDLDHLKEEVERRIRDLEAVRKEFQATKNSKDQWVADLRELNKAAVGLERKLTGLDVTRELPTLVRNAATDAVTVGKSVEERFQRYQKIRVDPKRKQAAQTLVAKLKAQMSRADQEVKALELTKEEQAIVETLQILNDLKDAFREFRRNTRTREAFERQIKSLSKVKDDFIRVQNAGFQNILDLLSEDISNYYLFLHPPKNENVDDVKLRIVGEEGVEFEYAFHGRKTHPPMKYLSESHLNSLGLALFLASVKLVNKECGFFVLDDVVTSFDGGHRIRLLRLLQEDFKDWQVILLTHERHWFEIIKKELGSVGWIIREVDWSQENGVQLRGVPEDLRGLIKLKRSQGHDVANDIRTLLESVLKEVCHSLQVRMAFRYNERNEERMAGELLSELRGTLNDKAPALKEHVILKQMETSNLLGTKGSHDRPKEISKGDIDVALGDIDNLETLFRCEKCAHLVSRERFIESEKKITCKCGKKTVGWKG